MGIKILFKIYKYVLEISLFNIEIHKEQSKEEMLKELMEAGVIQTQESDEVHRDDKGDRVIGFQGEKKDV